MNIRGWIDDITAELCEDEIDIDFFNQRLYLPDAQYSHTKQAMSIYGNAPSLVRFGLAHLIGHELAHHEHAKRYDGDSGDDFSPEFREIEREIIEKIWALCLNEHEPEGT